MRYYVFSIQYNDVAKAENRSVPSAFDNLDEALKKFHSQLATDMGNANLCGSICMVINSEMGILKSEKWGTSEYSATVEATTEAEDTTEATTEAE